MLSFSGTPSHKRKSLLKRNLRRKKEMTREDIIRMAREQGLPETEVEGVFMVNTDDLGRFAALVAAAERDSRSIASHLAIGGDGHGFYRGAGGWRGQA
jgi:predicted HicB family RNase H-like nuclease